MFTLTKVEGIMIFVSFIVLAMLVIYQMIELTKQDKRLRESEKAYEFMQEQCKEANSKNVKLVDIVDLLSEKDR